jgi:DNA polymerase-3 subunit epsilon
MGSTSATERVLVLDTETTGLSATARIVEIAAVEVEPRSGRIGSELHHIVNPLVRIPQVVSRIHGIRDRDVQGMPPFCAVAEQVATFVRGATVAIANAAFDRRILDAELARAGKPSLAELDVRIIDTLDVSRGVFPLSRGHSLDRICDRMAVDRSARTYHGALLDVRLLAQTLPKFAAEYDAWCAIADDGCARELDAFENELHVALGSLKTAGDASSPEGADRALCGLAAALSWIGRCESWLKTQGGALVGADGWCCKHFVARWVTSQGVSWKDAAGAYLAPEVLSTFRSESQTRTLTPRPDAAVTARLDALQSAFAPPRIGASIACVVRGLLLLRWARNELETQRRTLRDLLMLHVNDGYLLRHATLADGVRTATDYRAAMATLARGANLEPFTSRHRRLSVSPRDPASCAALFG